MLCNDLTPAGCLLTQDQFLWPLFFFTSLFNQWQRFNITLCDKTLTTYPNVLQLIRSYTLSTKEADDTTISRLFNFVKFATVTFYFCKAAMFVYAILWNNNSYWIISAHITILWYDCIIAEFFNEQITHENLGVKRCWPRLNNMRQTSQINNGVIATEVNWAPKTSILVKRGFNVRWCFTFS